MIKLSDTFVLTPGSFYQPLTDIVAKVFEIRYPDLDLEAPLVGAFIRPDKDDSFICGGMLDMAAQLIEEGCTLFEVVDILSKFYDETTAETVEAHILPDIKKWIEHGFIKKGRNNRKKVRYGQLQAMLRFADKKRGDRN